MFELFTGLLYADFQKILGRANRASNISKIISQALERCRKVPVFLANSGSNLETFMLYSDFILKVSVISEFFDYTWSI